MGQRNAGGRRSAFVTGASYGIGAASAVALARDGFDVAVAATRVENLSEVVSKIEATGSRVVPVALDLRLLTSLESAMETVVKVFDGLDVLVNNAGITLRAAAIDVTPEEWDAVIRTNLTGTFFMNQKMGRHLISRRQEGCIINVASTHGIVGFPMRVAYGTAKAAIIHMTKMLAVEWAGHGIRVNAIAPGTVETKSRAATLADPVAGEALLARIPVRRFAAAEEVSCAVSYLASPGASYVTGHTLVLDGGLTAA